MAMKWADGADDSLEPPGKELRSSGNFFDTNDGTHGVDYFDVQRISSLENEWKKEAHKRNRKKSAVATEIKPEMVPTIGETFVSEDGFPIPSSEVSRHSLPPGTSVTTDSHRERSSPLVSLPARVTGQPSQDSRQRPETSPADMKAPDVHSKPSEVVDGRWSVPTVKQTIDWILIDQPYVLEYYKSLEDKRLLLKEAISTHDTNTIITIVLFLRRTLSKYLFESLLSSNPVAAQQYCSFLRQNQAWETLKLIYYVLGEQKYAMIQLQMCLGIESIPKRLESLETIKMLFQRHKKLEKDASYIVEYINLLKRQQQIEKLRATLPASVANRYQGTPILDSPLTTTLMYCVRFHAKNPESEVVAPEALKKDFSIAEKQYFVIMFSSLCANKDWDSIDRLLTPKGWSSKLGIGSKLKAPVPVERIIRILGRRMYRVPEERMVKYLKMVEDYEKRLELSVKYECYGVGIEVLKQVKDTERLKAFVNSIPVEKQRMYRPQLVKLFS